MRQSNETGDVRKRRGYTVSVSTRRASVGKQESFARRFWCVDCDCLDKEAHMRENRRAYMQELARQNWHARRVEASTIITIFKTTLEDS